MPKRSTKEPVDSPFYFPEHQLTVYATDLREAQEKLPAAIKERKEGDEVTS